MRRRRLATLALVLLAVAVLALAFAWSKSPALPDNPSVTMREFLESSPFPSPTGTTYRIEDEVVDADTIRTPGLSWNSTGTFVVDGTARTTFTRVSFESIPTFSYHFVGDRLGDFPASTRVTFPVVFQEWQESGRSVVDIEHNHARRLLGRYDSEIRAGLYRPFDVETSLVNGTFSVRVTAVSDVFPLPANWTDIWVSFLRPDFTGIPAPVEGELFAGPLFVGNLTGIGSISGIRNGTIDLPLEADQELRLPYDGSYGWIRFDTPLTIGTIRVP